MSGPWEKFSAAAPADGQPWKKFQPPSGEPTWRETLSGAAKNLGPSFKAAIEPFRDENIGQTAKDTVKGLGTLGRSVAAFGSDPVAEFGTTYAELLNPGSTDDLRAAQKKEQERGGEALGRVRDYYAKRYGSMEGFKKALRDDPVGVGMDASVFLSAGATGLGKVPGVAKVASAPARATGNVGAHVLGHLTGAGPDAIKQAAKAGFTRETEFIDSLAGKLPAEDTVKMASKAIGKMRQERNAQYQAAMKVAGLENEAVDFNKILQGWQEAQKTGHFEGVPLAARTEGLDRQILNVLDDWYQNGRANPKFFSAEGIDALKKKIGSIKDSIPFEKRADRKYVGDLYGIIRDEITEQAPIYDKIMKDYAAASEGLEEIEKALSLGDKATYDTGIRKLLSAMRNNANSNYGNRLKMIDKMEEQYGAKGLKSRLAGMQMSSGLPRGLAGRNPVLTGLAGVLDPHALLALPFESPNLVGRGLYAAGSVPRLAGPPTNAAISGLMAGSGDNLLRQINGQ